MYFQKKNEEDLQKENTKIWTCQTKGCNSWMRDNFSFAYMPTCPKCHAPMVDSMKLLPLLVNSNGDLKSLKKGIQIEAHTPDLNDSVPAGKGAANHR